MLRFVGTGHWRFGTNLAVLSSEAQSFQKQTEHRRWLPPTGVVEVVAVERLAPVPKHTDQGEFDIVARMPSVSFVQTNGNGSMHSALSSVGQTHDRARTTVFGLSYHINRTVRTNLHILDAGV